MASSLSNDSTQAVKIELEMEFELLGSLILKEGSIIPKIAAILVPEDFFSHEHTLIYSAVLDLYQKHIVESNFPCSKNFFFSSK